MSLRDIIIDVIPDSFVNSWINHIGQTLSTLTSCHTYWVHINSIDNERSLYRTGDILKWIPHTKHSIIVPPSPATAHLLVIMKPRVWQHRPISQIPQCTSPKSHNAPFCNINVNICAHFCYKWCIVGYLPDACGICEMGLLEMGFRHSAMQFISSMIANISNMTPYTYSEGWEKCTQFTVSIQLGATKLCLNIKTLQLKSDYQWGEEWFTPDEVYVLLEINTCLDAMNNQSPPHPIATKHHTIITRKCWVP